jgi:Family of unknown function (DUF6009)
MVVLLCAHIESAIIAVTMSTRYDPRMEADIVWLDKSASALSRYAREILIKCSQRANRPKTSYRVVAYATLRPEAKSVAPGEFLRRVWYMSDHNVDGNPMQAVDPKSIRAGQWSLQWGWANSEETFAPSH